MFAYVANMLVRSTKAALDLNFYVRQAARPNFNLMMPYKVEVEVEVVEEDSRKL